MLWKLPDVKETNVRFGSKAVIRSLLGFGDRAGYLDLNIRMAGSP